MGKKKNRILGAIAKPDQKPIPIHAEKSLTQVEKLFMNDLADIIAEAEGYRPPRRWPKKRRDHFERFGK